MDLKHHARKIFFSPDFSIYRNFFFFSFASLVGNFFAFLYHFYSARQLSVAEYGVLSVLLSLFGVAILPLASFSSLLVKKVAQSRADAPAIARAALKVSLALGLAVLVLLIVFQEQFLSSFHISEEAIPSIFAILLGLAFLWLSLNGVLQGLERFFLSGFAFAIGSLAKLVLAFLLVYAGLFNLSTALVSYGITFAIASGLAIFSLRRILLSKVSKFSFRSMKSDYLKIVAIDIGFALIFNGDLVVLGMLFPGEQLGFYSAASLVAKIISYALLPISAVAFPRIVEQSSKMQMPKALLAASAFILAGGLGILIFYAFAGHLFLSFLYTEKYLPATSYLMVLSLAMVFYCLNAILSRYFVAIASRSYPIAALLSPIAGLSLLYFLHSMELAPFAMLATNLLLLLASLALGMKTFNQLPAKDKP